MYKIEYFATKNIIALVQNRTIWIHPIEGHTVNTKMICHVTCWCLELPASIAAVPILHVTSLKKYSINFGLLQSQTSTSYLAFICYLTFLSSFIKTFATFYNHPYSVSVWDGYKCMCSLYYWVNFMLISIDWMLPTSSQWKKPFLVHPSLEWWSQKKIEPDELTINSGK